VSLGVASERDGGGAEKRRKLTIIIYYVVYRGVTCWGGGGSGGAVTSEGLCQSIELGGVSVGKEGRGAGFQRVFGTRYGQVWRYIQLRLSYRS